MNSAEEIVFLEAASSYLLLVRFTKASELQYKDHLLVQPGRHQVNWLDFHWRRFLRSQKVEKVHKIYLGQGPGSFTSLRICFSYVRTLALINKIRVSSFSSLAFWRDFFSPHSELFLQKANRNLYYGITKNNEIVAKTVNDWHIHIERHNIATINVWPNAIQPNEELPFKFSYKVANLGNDLKLDSNFILNLCQKHFTENDSALADLLPNYVHDLTYHKKADKK